MSPACRPVGEADLAWMQRVDAETDAFPWGLANFADALSAGYSSWLLADGDTLLGFAVSLRVLDEAHLLKLTVAPAQQGRGYGGQLLTQVCTRMREAGATQLFLEVRASNTPARTLYARRGFEEIGQRRAYYPAASGREDAIVMRCAL